MKNKSYALFIIIILVLLNIFIFSTYKFVVFLGSPDQGLNISEIISRVVPPLLGAFLSAIVAFIIFYLTKLKEDLTKKSQSKMFLEIIEQDITSNINSVQNLFNIISTTPSKNLAPLLEENSATLELFKITSSNLSVEIIDKFLVQLNKKDFLIISEKVKNYKSLISSLDLLNNEITETKNKEIIIDRLKNLVDYFSNKADLTPPNKRKLSSIFTSLPPMTKNLLIILVVILLLHTLLNMVLIKFFLKV
ncbi:hypothetical protein [Lysinibacillus sp. LZ02]|uniref:hypothetical protein n=1 Tax=Lysinibacillus sp. LZ02 TaxID=3420668 RepID=UPI003D35FECF